LTLAFLPMNKKSVYPLLGMPGLLKEKQVLLMSMAITGQFLQRLITNTG
jgi:hypothetical protein